MAFDATLRINGRYLAHRVTGVQRYAREITGRWGEPFELIRPWSRARGPLGHLWEQTDLVRRAAGGLLWSPTGTGPLAVRQQVVTIHDCAFLDRRQGFSRLFSAWYGWLVPRLARRVARIITVSEFSRERIVDRCRVPASRIEVIPNGVSAHFRPQSEQAIAAVRRKLDLPERYLLCVGSLDPRKNQQRLLEAWTAVADALPDWELVMVGAANRVFRRSPLTAAPRLRLTGYVDDADLPAVYAAAELFVYPSLYEGFGLTVLEAMACGAPVICSNVASLPEVAGDAAVQVDPTDRDAIAAAIRDLAGDPALRQQLRTRGLRRAQQFTWDTAAARTWRVLEETANDSA